MDVSDAAIAASALFKRVAREASAMHASRNETVPLLRDAVSGRIMAIPATRRRASLGYAKGQIDA
jgi:hypothetical protein